MRKKEGKTNLSLVTVYMNKRGPIILTSFVFTILMLAACSLPPSTQTAPTQPVSPDDTSEPFIEPTPTEVVIYVAQVNGEGIRQSGYEASLKQFQAAQTEFGNLLEEDETAETRVMDALINRALLSQAARAAGFTADETLVKDRMNQLTEQAGGSEIFASWLGNNGYTQETFLVELAIEIEAAWQRDKIVNAVPETAEQVKARQIFFYDAYQASRIYDQLKAGIPFDVIVANNDPDNRGYLDWFPRGYLFYPELETAAFSLQPGEFSEVIETEIGYHIIQVLEYDPAHQLSTDARLTMQTRVLEEWLTQQRNQSQIDIFSP